MREDLAEEPRAISSGVRSKGVSRQTSSLVLCQANPLWSSQPGPDRTEVCAHQPPARIQAGDGLPVYKMIISLLDQHPNLV